MVVVSHHLHDWCVKVLWCRRRSLTDTVVTQDNCVVSCAPGSTCSGNTGWHQLAAADIEVTQVGQCYQPLAGSRYYNRFNIRGTRVSGGRTLRGAYAMPAMRAWRVQPAGQRSVNAALTHQGAVVLVDGLVGIGSSGSNREWHVLGTVLQLEPLVSGAVTRKVLFPEGYSNLVLIPIADLNQLLGVVPMGSATNGEHHVVEPGLATLHSSSFRAPHSTPLSSTAIWPLSTPVLSAPLHSTLLHSDLATLHSSPITFTPFHSPPRSGHSICCISTALPLSPLHCTPRPALLAGPLFAMPEASSFFMSRASGDTLEQFGTKRACTSGCESDDKQSTQAKSQETVPFGEVAGLSAVQAQCVLKMANMKPGSATAFKPSQRTLGYGELRAAGFVKMESVVSARFPDATSASIEFLDLGSGLGAVVAFAAIIAGWHAKGLEMCPKQHSAAACWFSSSLMPEFPNLTLAGRLMDAGQLLCGDMRAPAFGSIMQKANVIFMNNLLFDDISTGGPISAALHSTALHSAFEHSDPVHSTQLKHAHHFCMQVQARA